MIHMLQPDEVIAGRAAYGVAEYDGRHVMIAFPSRRTPLVIFHEGEWPLAGGRPRRGPEA